MKYILFDLDGTLLDFHKSEKKSFMYVINSLTGYNPTDLEYERFKEINENLFNSFARGEMKRIEFQEKRFEEIYSYMNINGDKVNSNKLFLDTLKYQADLYDDVSDVLEYLNGKYELYIASNGMDIVQRKRLESANISKYFKDVFVSDTPKANKPDIKFFEYVFNMIKDPDKNEYVIIGDRYDTDILGGKNAHINTIWLNREEKVEGAINSLIELKNIL